MRHGKTCGEWSAVTILTATLAWGATPAIATEHAFANAIPCSGCSEQRKQAQAANAGDNLAVYVFDREARQVGKYRVEAEVLGKNPYTVRKQVLPQEPEQDLVAAYLGIVNAWDEMADGYPLVPPPNRSLQTLAQVQQAPGGAMAALEDLLNEDSAFFSPGAYLQALSAAWLAHGLPRHRFMPTVLDFGRPGQRVYLPIQLVDGATFNAWLGIEFDPSSARHRWLLLGLDDFRTSDGQPAASVAGPGARG